MDTEELYEDRNVKDIYNLWLGQIQRIEDSIISNSSENDTATYNSLTIGFRLFPIINAVASTIFKSGPRKYLRELGYTKTEANLIYTVFRNGQLHNTKGHVIEYDNLTIRSALMSTTGSESIHAFNWGYNDPEDPTNNYPPERTLFLIKEDDRNYIVTLMIDRLTAQVRDDIRKRLSTSTDEIIDYYIGQKIHQSIDISDIATEE